MTEICANCGKKEGEHYYHKDSGLYYCGARSSKKFKPDYDYGTNPFNRRAKPQNHSPEFNKHTQNNTSKYQNQGCGKLLKTTNKCQISNQDNLSKKIWDVTISGHEGTKYHKGILSKDVREFIKDILGMIDNEELIDWDDFVEYIKQRAGADLV